MCNNPTRPPVVEWIRSIGEAGLAVRADIKSFMYSRDLMDTDMTALRSTPDTFHAQVQGTYPYVVTFRWRESSIREEPSVSCTCPVVATWCKHAVAVAMRLMREPEWQFTIARPEVTDAALERMSRHDLLKLINSLRQEYPPIEATVTTLAMPHWYAKTKDLVEVQEAIERARETKDPADWMIAVNRIYSACQPANGVPLLRALERVILDMNDCALQQALRPTDLHHVIDTAYRHHISLCRFVEPEPEHLREWLLETYFAPGPFVPTEFDEYSQWLDDDDVRQLLSDAYAKFPLHPERVHNLACDVAIYFDDVEELQRLVADADYQDQLFWYYDESCMFTEAEELLERALDPRDTVTFTPEFLLDSCQRYFDEDADYRFFLYRFLLDPTVQSFSNLTHAHNVTFERAMEAAAGHDSSDEFALIAATTFDRFDTGFDAITNGAPSAELVDDFAEKVGIAYDPEWAVGLMFSNSVRIIKESANPRVTVGRLWELRQKLASPTAPNSDEALMAWHSNMKAFREQALGDPVLSIALEEWGL
ncbi:SWIM zinc finger family protein [Corynebacterium aquatimens]|uniref:SWIM-type domain-containing protein n=1 Tax=Corynebacterium aquatimens TaxID=1190508 RepID=A0A931DX19_9CORY|nr:hypothetical protein [Corynebacterium aquatimens]MBG6123129.1 hypothetical protein [Corynebacterium aquatimens]WJY66539.1 hypothetical protein CAQUA_09260 [Corynebacterium aquatimens]